MGGFSIWHFLILLIMFSPLLLLIFYRQKRVVVRHAQSGLTKNGFYGFSPTYLCFGWFVPLFRGEIGIAALHLLFSIVTFGLWQIIAAFIYNRQYTARLLTNGWVLADTPENEAAARFALNIN
ncbi:hypothetical protein [Aquisediminimonas sediminicola]|uniref:hypothetical protein n=1 Tax=Alteraquisediminimonas sediminicola TaxID=2676787 RepID=UPI001C8F07EF|nr:hypothetical protein [Aquisediminimonas sediminicola]